MSEQTNSSLPASDAASTRRVRPVRGGPVLIDGPVEIELPDGRIVAADRFVVAVCACGRKATMNLRVDASGHAVREGAQTEIGGNDRYVAVCRRHFSEAFAG